MSTQTDYVRVGTAVSGGVLLGISTNITSGIHAGNTGNY